MSRIIKKISFVIICLLVVNVVTAVDEFEVTLIAYNAETQSAQIGIKNIDSNDHYDVYMAIDNSEPVNIVGLLRQGNAIKVSKGIPPGKHTITVSTPHGAITKKIIDFPKSQEQIKEELEKEKLVKELTGKQKEEKKVAERVYEVKKKPISNTLIIIILLVLFLLLLYFIFKKEKKNINRR